MPKISTTVLVNIDDISETEFPVEFPVEVNYNIINDYGWIGGCITVRNVGPHCECYYEFEAKVYDRPSKYGIDEGCISKLYVRDVDTDTEVLGYDRGWYFEPYCLQEYAALNALLEIFDTPLEWVNI